MEESVLSYWFREGFSLSKLGKTLWFVEAGYDRDSLDTEIGLQFSSVLQETIHACIDVSTISARQILARVLLLDQFSRHVYRNNDEMIQRCTLKALVIAKDTISKFKAPL